VLLTVRVVVLADTSSANTVDTIPPPPCNIAASMEQPMNMISAVISSLCPILFYLYITGCRSHTTAAISPKTISNITGQAKMPMV